VPGPAIACHANYIGIRKSGPLVSHEMSLPMGNEITILVLTIVTTLFLPPTLVIGVFGMNTKGLPLTDVETGFLWAAALMVCSSLLVYLIMRRIGIFKRIR
jgi:hypothetical protein